MHQEVKAKTNVSKIRLLSHLSDPLSRKIYEPKTDVKECTNNDNIAPSIDKRRQLSSRYRKEATFATSNSNSEDGIEDENIALCTFESSKVKEIMKKE